MQVDKNAILRCSVLAVISMKNGSHPQKVGGENGLCKSSEHSILNEVQDVCYHGTVDNHEGHDLNQDRDEPGEYSHKQIPTKT